MNEQLSLEEVRAMSDAPTIIALFLTLVFVAVFSSFEQFDDD